jgi:hypothetical protein
MSFFDKDNNDIDDELDYQFQSHYKKTNVKQGKNGVSLSQIAEIDPSTRVMYNRVNVHAGRRTSGKTYTCIKKFIKIFHTSKRTHLLVDITKNPNIIDHTFNEL